MLAIHVRRAAGPYQTRAAIVTTNSRLALGQASHLPIE